MHRLSFAVTLLAALALPSIPVFAAVATVGDVTPVPPAAGGAVTGPFTIGNTGTGSVTVTFGTPQTPITSTNQATLGSSATGVGVVELNGPGSNWTLTTAGADLTVGNSGSGTILVFDQARLVVNDDCFIAGASGGAGQIIVSGFGSAWQNGDDVTIGQSGLGVVEVNDSGQITSQTIVLGQNANGDGQAIVDGTFSRWQVSGAVTVGDGGAGSLTVRNGGRLTNSSNAIVGSAAGSVGVVDIVGSNSLWEISGTTLSIGNLGDGTVRVRDGGRLVSNVPLGIGNTPGANANILVDGPNSRFTVAGALTTGTGEGQITLANGGLFTTTAASTLSATTELTLAGGTWRTTAAGNTAINVLGLIQGGGTLDAAGVTIAVSGNTRGKLRTATGDHLRVTGALVNNGNIDLDGGELEVLSPMINTRDVDLRNGATLRTGGSGLDNQNAAQIAITAGTVDIFGDVENSAGAEIAVVGGAIAVFHDPLTNIGNIFVAPGSELIQLDDLNFGSGSFSVGLGAIAPEDDPTEAFGRAVTSGSASLDGNLTVSLDAGFAPALGDTYQILQADDGRSGTFGVESLPALAGPLTLDVVYSSNAVTLAVVPELTGDYNANGAVDTADYTVWRDSLNRSGPALAADGNRDGTVNDADYAVWKSNFGDTLGSGATDAAQVPEPSALLLISAIAAFAGRRTIASRELFAAQ